MPFNGDRIGFEINLKSANPRFVRFGLYTESTKEIGIPPFKSNAAEFMVRSIEFINMISPHGLITGLIGQWMIGERNHVEFFTKYISRANNLHEAASQTWSGRIACQRLGFNKISQIPGLEDTIPVVTEPLSLIFSKD